MWRSFFLAVAIMMIILGIECLMIESASLYAAKQSSATELMDPTMPPAATTRVWQPAEAVPWALLSGGAVIILYAITLPKRWAAGGEPE
ncbi:hypothetical protein [Roseimaritima sediminicola]|uniref:hypothetical protein n=1 Tax=Roseimaritima sediminicola TaxID=2662066 RepID=UPI00129845B8|nr:hypothetical protein [Roseimaritima sediminicola]